MTYITGGTVHADDGVIRDGVVGVEGSTIMIVSPAAEVRIPSGSRVVDAAGGDVIPGLIDIHFHGCLGFGLESLGRLAEDLAGIAAALPQWATTGFLIAPILPPLPAGLEYLKQIAEICEDPPPGAGLLGINMEGPFISPGRRGALPPGPIRPPSPTEARQCVQAARGQLRLVTMAPELPGSSAAAQVFLEGGARLSLGHSAATYEQALSALDGGPYSQVTHCFNAMTGLHHREPGVVGAVMNSRSACAEIIADGLHVHPAMVRLLYRMLGPGRLIAVTDANPAAGMDDGVYHLGEVEFSVKDGKATLPDGTLAGSTLTMDRALANLREFTGCGLGEALQMASLNPARQLGLEARKGRVAPGFDADLVVLDEKGRSRMTMVRGQIVFER